MSQTLRLADLEPRPPLPAARADEFAAVSHAIHASLDPQAAAFAIVQAGRCWIGCDRLSVLVRRGRRWEVLAISGQQHVSRFSPTVIRLGQLVSQVAARGTTWSFNRSDPDASAGSHRTLAEYLSVSAVSQIRIEPLCDEGEPSPTRRGPQASFGALVFESFGEIGNDALPASRIELLVPTAKAALHHALTVDRIFLRSTLSSLGRCWSAVSHWRIAAWLLGLLLLIGMIASFGTISADVRVEAVGRLVPVHQACIFAPADGEIVDLFVRSGERVEAGQPLLKLWDQPLAEQLILIRNRITEVDQGLAGLKAELHEAGRNAAERAELVRLQTRSTQSQIELQGLRLQLKLLEGKESQLTVAAPLGGIVTTNDLNDRLAQRPVRRGELLLELADDAGPWQLELNVPERQYGKLVGGTGSHEPAAIPVEYRLSSRPDVSYRGVVRHVATRAVIVPQQGACVAVQAEIDARQLPEAWIGADVVARLQGPRTNLAEVLFGDVIDFWHRATWW